MRGVFKSLFFSAFISTAANSQVVDYYAGTSQIGLFYGANSFMGDIGGKNGDGAGFLKDFTTIYNKPSVNLNYNYFFNDRISVKFQIEAGTIQAADSHLHKLNRSGRYWRNLSFKSPVSELAIGAAYHFRKFGDNHLNNLIPSRFSVSIFLGAGIFRFNPKAKLNNVWYALKPLSTEGQGMAEYKDRSAYKLLQLYIPVELSFSYALSDNWNAHAAIKYRKTFTDYLDDVSTQYINPDLFDKYLSPSQALVAKNLNNRTRELNNGISLVQEGDTRGNRNKDTWITISIGISTFLFPQN